MSRAHGPSMAELPGKAGTYIEDIKHQLGEWIRENVPTVGGWIADIFDGREPEWVQGVGRMARWLMDQVGKPYIWGGGHPANPNLPGYDCSGLVSSALQVGGFPGDGVVTSLAGQVAAIPTSAMRSVPVLLGFYGDLSHVGMSVFGKWFEATPPHILGPGAASSSWDWYGVPALAAGGVVKARPGGTIVRLSEAGYDEAVIPLKRGGSSGGGNTYEITIVSAATDPVRAGEEMYRRLKQKLERESRLNS